MYSISVSSRIVQKCSDNEFLNFKDPREEGFLIELWGKGTTKCAKGVNQMCKRCNPNVRKL